MNTSTTLFPGIDLHDLSYGEGKWRNMQDVLRSSFCMAFEYIERQHHQIASLTDTLSALRKDIDKISVEKVNNTDVSHMIESKLIAQSRIATIDDMSSLTAQLAEIRANMERKATIRYVDESMKRKVDKTDLVMSNYRQKKTTVSCNGQHSPLLEKNVDEIKTRLLHLEVNVKSINSQLQDFATKEHCNKLRCTVDELQETVSLKVDRPEMKYLLDMKMGQTEAHERLGDKADRASVERSIRAIENVLAEHEKTITSLNLGSRDDGMPMGYLDGMIGGSHVQSSPGSGTNSARMERLLAAGRDEALKKTTTSRLVSATSKLEALETRLYGDIESRIVSLEQAENRLSNNVQAQANCIKKHSEDISSLSELSLGLDATNEQIQELRAQQGSPLSVPLSAVVVDLEGRINELDEVIKAEIVLGGRGRTSTEQSVVEMYNNLKKRVHGVESEIKKVDSIRHSLADVQREFSSLKHATGSLNKKVHQHEKLLCTSRVEERPTEETSAKPSEFKALANHIRKLESFCSISGSRSIHSVQDIVEAIRSLRRTNLALEDKLNTVEAKWANFKSKGEGVDSAALDADRQHTTLLIRELSQRVDSCEVVDQVHQVRLESIEDSLNQLEISKKKNRHVAEVLDSRDTQKDSGSSRRPRSSGQ